MVPTAEETGIGEKPTAEANKCVAEVLERQWLGQSTRKHRATVHSEARRLGSTLRSMEQHQQVCMIVSIITNYVTIQISIN